jgi:hypothetical protein
MKPSSAIAAAAMLVVAVIAVAYFCLVALSNEPSSTIIIVLPIVLIVIVATVSAIKSPQAPWTKVVFCALAVLFGLTALYSILIGLQQTPLSFGPFFWFLIFMAGIAIPSVMTIGLARNSALLYGVYGFVIPMWLLSLGLLVLDLFFKFYGR